MMLDPLKVFLLCLLINLVCVEAQTINLRRQIHNMQEFNQLHHYSSSSISDHLTGAIICFLASPICFVLSFIMIWHNQRKAAIDYRRMKLAQSLVSEVNPFNQNDIQSSYGKLVHVTGDSECNETLIDAESGIAFNGVIKIFRQVQVREFRQFGTEKNIRYELKWVSQNLPSPGGGYSNDPGCWFINSKTTYAKRVNIGNYLLNQNQIQRLRSQQAYKPKQQDAYNIASRSNGRVKNQPIVDLFIGEQIYFPTIAGTLDGPGTLRVRYTYCAPGQTSIIAQSQKNTFAPFRIDIKENGIADMQQHTNNCCCCLLSDCVAVALAPIKQIDLITQRKISYHEMIQQQLKSIRFRTNSFRLFSYLLMVSSICAFFIPLTTIIGFVPFLGSFLSNTIGLAVFLAAVIVCIPLFLLTLSISWLFFHPKVGLILLGIGLVITGIVLAVIFTNEGNNYSNDAQKTAEAVKHLANSLKSLF